MARKGQQFQHYSKEFKMKAVKLSKCTKKETEVISHCLKN